MGVGLHSNVKAVKLESIGISSVLKKNVSTFVGVKKEQLWYVPDPDSGPLILPWKSAGENDKERVFKNTLTFYCRITWTRGLIPLGRFTVNQGDLTSPPVCGSSSQMSYFNNRYKRTHTDTGAHKHTEAPRHSATFWYVSMAIQAGITLHAPAFAQCSLAWCLCVFPPTLVSVWK